MSRRRERASYQQGLDDLVAAVLGEAGVTPVDLRMSVLELAEHPSAREDRSSSLEPEVTSFVRKLAQKPGDVDDSDLAGLRGRGRSEDEAFDVLVAASVGAGLVRWRAGVAALRDLR